MARRNGTVKMAPRQQTLAELFSLDGNTFERNGVSTTVLYKLRNLVDSQGLPKVAKDIGVCDITVLRVIAGFAHRLRPETCRKVVEYFNV